MDVDVSAHELIGVGEEPPTKKAKRAKATGTDPTIRDLTWTPSDDFSIRESCMSGTDVAKIAKLTKFSFGKAKPLEVQERWRQMLYDREVSEQSAKAIAATEGLVPKRVQWSETEENILKTESTGTGFSNYLHLIEKRRNEFHWSRTAKSLETHNYKLKKKDAPHDVDAAAASAATPIVFHSVTPASLSHVEESADDENVDIEGDVPHERRRYVVNGAQ